jgi:hypothetical protein
MSFLESRCASFSAYTAAPGYTAGASPDLCAEEQFSRAQSAQDDLLTKPRSSETIVGRYADCHWVSCQCLKMRNEEREHETCYPVENRSKSYAQRNADNNACSRCSGKQNSLYQNQRQMGTRTCVRFEAIVVAVTVVTFVSDGDCLWPLLMLHACP